MMAFLFHAHCLGFFREYCVSCYCGDQFSCSVLFAQASIALGENY